MCLRLAVFVLGCLAPLCAAAEETLSDRLRAALAVPAFQDAAAGALVVRADSGALLFERAADRAFVPASNQKLPTALAVLASFGPAHRFTTAVYADRPPDAAGAVGTLYVRGGGDPALTSELCWRLAADLYREGLRRVGGALVLDASLFDGMYWHPAWQGVSTRAYHAPVAALAVNYSTFSLKVRGSREVGAPLKAVLDPPVPFLALSVAARVGVAGGADSLRVERQWQEGRERVALHGELPAGAETEDVYASVGHPELYFGAVLRMQLAALGISVAGPTQLARLPETAAPLLEFQGHSLAEIVRLMLKYSNNAIAESLVKNLGAQATGGTGTWENGVAALRQRLSDLGVPLSGLVLLDGSGLALENRVSPRTLVAALQVAKQSFFFGPELLAALPLGGTDGTLKKRAEKVGPLLRAKTGFLTGATGLSGYARARDGSETVFSILVNGYQTSDDAVQKAVDGFVAALVSGSPAAAGGLPGR